MIFFLGHLSQGNNLSKSIKQGFVKGVGPYCNEPQFCRIFKMIMLITIIKCVVVCIFKCIKQLKREYHELMRHNDVI